MSDEQISLPAFAIALLVSGLIIRYLFFAGSRPEQAPTRAPEQLLRSRELAVERIQQMFPQAERRNILWDLQRNGGNIQDTTERILAGRLETPPITFQPPAAPNQAPASGSSTLTTKQPEKPKQLDLITRYNLKEKLDTEVAEEEKKGRAWSSSREERQAALQSRRDEMILAARRNMEAKMAAEKAARGS